MLDKRVKTLADAVAGIKDGAVVLIAGFGSSGIPVELIHALIDQGARDLTVVSNNAGSGRTDLAALLAAGRVRKLICSYPKTSGSVVFEELYAAGKIELELVPQGTLSERMRAAGAGLGGFYTPTGVGTDLAKGKEVRTINGREYVFETPLKGDVALIKAERADRWGNLVYHAAARNFAPTMAMAADLTIVQAREIVERRSAGRPWGWKEPRTTLFLDFWAEFLPEARFLLLFRHPLAVVDSLVRRGTEKEIRWRPVIGLRAWRIYNEQALRFARSQPERAMVVEIESVIQSPERFNEELDRKFELGLRPVPFGTVFSNGEFASGVPKGLGLVKLFHRSELNRALDCYRELLRVSAPIASPSAPITRQAF